MAEVRVIKPGMLTSIQDLGRWGFQSRGVPVAGPMDSYSHRVANALAGNGAGAATLEVTLLGPELQFDDERAIGVAGAEFELTVNGRAVAANTAFAVSAGSCLRFGRRLRGTRAYVAIRGGIGVMPVFGSRATHLTSRMGGLDGRSLEAGDRLPLGDPGPPGCRYDSPAKAGARRQPARIRAVSDGHATVRILPGPQDGYFADEAFRALQAEPYVVGQHSDRMGFRLEGTPLRHTRGSDIISDATPMGALQVPASGLPILLMADRQTAGGYAKIATVITADLDLAGQLGPGDRISFVVCSARDAIAALIARERALMAIESPEVP
jgi:antagonist of KipI